MTGMKIRLQIKKSQKIEWIPWMEMHETGQNIKKFIYVREMVIEREQSRPKKCNKYIKTRFKKCVFILKSRCEKCNIRACSKEK